MGVIFDLDVNYSGICVRIFVCMRFDICKRKGPKEGLGCS